MNSFVSGPVQPAHPHALPFRIIFHEHLLRRKTDLEDHAVIVFGLPHTWTDGRLVVDDPLRAKALDLLERKISAQESAYKALQEAKNTAGERLTKAGTGRFAAMEEGISRLLRECVAQDRELKYLLHRMNSSALCLSGGGIRSASFCLGVLQGLAGFTRSTPSENGLLDKLDYLSTVSGGGYIGSWLSSWVYRRTRMEDAKAFTSAQGKPWGEAYREVLTALANPAPDADRTLFHREPVTGGDPEPQPVRHLRSYTSFLAPALGITVDSFTLVAIYLRNLVINWVMLLPLLLAAIAAVRFQGLGFQWASGGALREEHAFFISAALLILAALCAAFSLPSHAKVTATKKTRIWLPIAFCALVTASCWCLATTTPPPGCWHLWADHNTPSCPIVRYCSPFTALGVCTLIALVNFGILGFSIWLSAKRRMQELTARMDDRNTPSAVGSTSAQSWSEVVAPSSTANETSDSGPSASTTPSEQHVASAPAQESFAKRTHSLRLRGRAFKRIWGSGMKLRHPLTSGFLIFLAVVAASLVTSGLLDLVQTKLLPGLDPLRGLRSGLHYMDQPDALYLIFALPAILGVLLLSTTFFCALAGLYEREEDREWWARVGGIFLAIGVVWMLAHAIVFYGDSWLYRLAAEVGILLGGMGSLLGASASTAAGPRPIKTAQATKVGSFLNKHDLLLPLISVVSIGLIVIGNVALEETLRRHFLAVMPKHHGHAVLYTVFYTFLFCLACTVIALLVNRAINVNIFSLHGMYRMRLMRAFLGASNALRHPDRFTNFDPEDTPLMAELAHDPGAPLHLICTTLNLVGTKETAWRQRKAESFTFSSVCAGGWRVGFVPMEQYGGPKGASLASAMSISGAAFNPNMGYQSSPVLSLLMTIFCVRLGVWMPNPRMPEAARFKKFSPSGRDFFTKQGPSLALQPLLSEAFGLTDDSTRWVELTDGGHFENLGLYEMILRRCKNIIVVDAGADPDCQFEDLGNAIRKIRIDLGVPIRLEPDLKMAAHAQLSNKYCVVGKIDYGCVDDLPEMPSKDVEGRLIYIKAGITGREPADVLQYARTHPSFPHETTVNQFFNESQFESYRHLGTYIIEQIIQKQPRPATLRNVRGKRSPAADATFDAFYEAAKAYWGRA